MLVGRQAVHPFPARMAPPVMAEKLINFRGPLEVLDPMMGSGSTLLAGLCAGHHVTGDRDTANREKECDAGHDFSEASDPSSES